MASIPPTDKPAPARIGSIDTYRGFVMFLLMLEVLRLPALARQFPESPFWRWVAFSTLHVEWRGCSLHDLIQPSFTFLVGVALPFSLASRMARGQSVGRMSLHAVWRAVVLVFLGIFLRSIGQPQTNFTFVDTLTQIGLGYFPLFLLGLTRRRWQVAALVTILVGYWLAYIAYPLPPADFDYQSVGVTERWVRHESGLAAHWNINSNLGWAFDTWFLNLFPRTQPFQFNPGGYSTLSFIPTLATMILGLIAGSWLRESTSPVRVAVRLALVGAALLATGLALDWLGICPNVKRLWTPSWVLVSGGWCFLLLAGFHAITDVARFTAWSLPLRVIGANSIIAYMMTKPLEAFVAGTFHTHLSHAPFLIFGERYEPLLTGLAVFLVYYLILLWMYRNKIFIRI